MSDRETLDHRLDEMRLAYEQGNGEALLAAIDTCFKFGIELPVWAKEGFSACWDRYRSVVPDSSDRPNVSTLGGAFGVERGKGFTASAARRRRLVTLIWQFVERRKREGQPVDDALFEAAAEEVGSALAAMPGAYEKIYGIGLPDGEAKGISAATARLWYYAFKRERGL